MNKGKSAVESVTLRTKGNKTEGESAPKAGKRLRDEPEMKALQGLIGNGAVSVKRVQTYLRSQENERA